VGVVDRDQHWAACREVGRQPVQAVQHCKRRVVRGRVDDRAEEQRPHRGGGSGEQHVALCFAGAREAALEQLAYHAEGEVRLELGPACARDLVPELSGPPGRRVDQRRLADTRPTLDHEDAAATAKQRLDRGQLALALEQLLHGITLGT